MLLLPPRSTLFPYTTLFRSDLAVIDEVVPGVALLHQQPEAIARAGVGGEVEVRGEDLHQVHHKLRGLAEDRKSTRLNSSHGSISYAVFCLKKKKKKYQKHRR